MKRYRPEWGLFVVELDQIIGEGSAGLRTDAAAADTAAAAAAAAAAKIVL
jgi:hypothetical protein